MAPVLGFLSNIGPLELLIIGLIAFVLFGAKLPEVARNVGRSLSQLKRGMQDASDEMKRELDAVQQPPPVPPKPEAVPGPTEPADQEPPAAGPAAEPAAPPVVPALSCAPKPTDKGAGPAA